MKKLAFHYHDRYCKDDGECRAHDPNWNWTHHEMADRIEEWRSGES